MELLRQEGKLMLIEGILFVILGILAMALPVLFSLGLEMVFGWLLIIGGGFQGYRAITSKHRHGFAFMLIGSLISIIVGILMLVYPLQGLLTLTLLLAIYFLIEGIAKIAYAMTWKPLEGWGWLLFSGLIAIALGAIILSGFPGTALWVLGLLLGINMIFFGWALIFLSCAAK